ncbi:MAG TPA: TonB-dependent receptor [Thermoanaerobaculia bacterium]|nr:TonB-dependent receptor [Thermoanaerobaculia bacterium]
MAAAAWPAPAQSVEGGGQDVPDELTVEDEITVTASRVETPSARAAAAVTVVDAGELDASAALTLDDTLQQVPGFTLFRRSGSRTANPTTQGASLRGVGGSAASRALVLADGVPLNDPFGGWVAWGRVPRAALARVEVVRGGASDLYGSSALVGVVHLLRREPVDAGAVEVQASAGELGTASLGTWASLGRGAWDGSVAADLLTTEGHVPVAPAERGAADAPAGVEHLAAEGTIGWSPLRSDGGGAPRLFLRAGFFDEERTNGTRLQDNDTVARDVTLGADGALAGGAGTLRLWRGEQDYRQTFTAVADDRDSERLVRAQHVPADTLGLTGHWARPLPARTGAEHTLVLGLDLRQVEGVSRERVFLPDRVLAVAAGGEQVLAGLFAEDVVRLSPRLTGQLALRWDRWENRALEGGPVRTEDAWSPRLAVRWQPTPAWGVRAAAYRSFRAPTLNELYRGFRVGDVVTDPNPELTAETLAGYELGATLTPRRLAAGGWQLRGTLFWMELSDAISNVTLEITPQLVQRRRENVGRSRSRGVELEASGRLGPRLTLTAGYLWADAEVLRFPADPSLEGRRLPQVPEHQATLAAGWRAPAGFRVDLQARWAGDAWDDDRNRFPLGEMTVVDLRLARELPGGFAAFVAVENLFDEESVVGRTPVATLGAPRLARVGVRFRR